MDHFLIYCMPFNQPSGNCGYGTRQTQQLMHLNSIHWSLLTRSFNLSTTLSHPAHQALFVTLSMAMFIQTPRRNQLPRGKNAPSSSQSPETVSLTPSGSYQRYVFQIVLYLPIFLTCFPMETSSPEQLSVSLPQP